MHQVHIDEAPSTLNHEHTDSAASASSHGTDKYYAARPSPAPTTQATTTQAGSAAETTRPTTDVDGGVIAWLQVVASFMLFFNSWGLVNAYGAYQTFYETKLLSHQSSSTISWIGSIQAFLLLFVGSLSGPEYDRGRVLWLNIRGTILIVIGMMITASCTRYYQILLAQGICTGVGMGTIFIQSVAIIPPYFSKRRALATGISVCGSSLGGMIYPIVFHRLEPRIGFGWATRVIAFIALATQATAIALMRQRGPTSKSRALIDKNALTELPMLSFEIAAVFAFMGLYIPFYYIGIYGQAKVHNMPSSLTAYLVPLLNVGSVFGRLIPNFLADKTGCLNMFLVTSILAAVVGYAWLSVNNVPKLVLFCLFYGAFSGSYVSLQGPTVAMLTADKSRLGSRMGTFCLFAAVGMLVGNPVAGAIIDVDSGRFWPAQVFCATLIVCACICLMVTRYLCSPAKILVKI